MVGAGQMEVRIKSKARSIDGVDPFLRHVIFPPTSFLP